MLDKTVQVDTACLELFHKILCIRTEKADDPSSRIAYSSALDMLEYVLSGSIDCLAQFDYITE